MHDICKNLGKADIVISHNSPLSIHDSRDDGNNDIAHLGFEGLNEYMRKHCPKYLIHGHQHINKTTNYLGVKVVGIYGASILDVDTGNLEKIF